MSKAARVTTLPFADDSQWRWRWVRRPDGRSLSLHRVLFYREVDDGWAKIYGVITVCGRAFKRTGMPGILSRMGAPRCRACCRRLGIAEGDGAPFNAHIEEPAEVVR